MRCMLVLCVALLCCSGRAAYANAGVFGGNGHTIELSSTHDIQMVSEVVTITPGRGRFLFDGSVRGLDRVEYDCRFVLKNLTGSPVTIQVGFPLDAQANAAAEHDKQPTSQWVARYSFIAQEEERQYSVRYVPADREKTFTHIFLWEMAFAPEETKTLQVTYAMPITLGAASTELNWETSGYGKEWYRSFTGGLFEQFGYVTRTGRSWSGTINRATFRVFVKGFEEYIRQRPLVETPGEAEAEAAVRERFPTRIPTVLRTTTPDDWKADADGFLTRTVENYEPDEGLTFSYYLLGFPRGRDDLERLMRHLWSEGPSAEDRQDLADIFREFNGTRTGNQRIQKLVQNQTWYWTKHPERVPEDVIVAVAEYRVRASPMK